MGRGAAGSPEPGGSRRRGAGPGREPLPARASRPRPRLPRPGSASPRKPGAGRGRLRCGHALTPLPARQRPALGYPPAPSPPTLATRSAPPATRWLRGSSGRPALTPLSKVRPPRALQDPPARRPQPAAPFPGAASSSVAYSSLLPSSWPLGPSRSGCFSVFFPLSTHLCLSASPCQCLCLTPSFPCVLSLAPFPVFLSLARSPSLRVSLRSFSPELSVSLSALGPLSLPLPSSSTALPLRIPQSPSCRAH